MSAPQFQRDRRSLIKKSAIAGAAGWIAPAIVSSPAGAAARSCPSAFTPTVIVPAPVNSSNTGSCVLIAENTASICWEPGQPVFLARDAAGTLPPVFDELAIIEVTPPSGPANVVRWVIRYWENVCALQQGPFTNEILIPGAPVDITAMFGAESGDFLIRVSVWNFFSPGFSSTVWVVPS